MLVIRNKAYTHLKEARDEIRRIGQFVFWRDNDRLSGYVSQYSPRKNQGRKRKEEPADA